jgi:hypothetical protein
MDWANRAWRSGGVIDVCSPAVLTPLAAQYADRIHVVRSYSGKTI